MIISFTVILIECTNETSLALPVLLSLMVSYTESDIHRSNQPYITGQHIFTDLVLKLLPCSFAFLHAEEAQCYYFKARNSLYICLLYE